MPRRKGGGHRGEGRSLPSPLGAGRCEGGGCVTGKGMRAVAPTSRRVTPSMPVPPLPPLFFPVWSSASHVLDFYGGRLFGDDALRRYGTSSISTGQAVLAPPIQPDLRPRPSWPLQHPGQPVGTKKKKPGPRAMIQEARGIPAPAFPTGIPHPLPPYAYAPYEGDLNKKKQGQEVYTDRR